PSVRVRSLSRSADHRGPLSSPTRRSSDLLSARHLPAARGAAPARGFDPLGQLLAIAALAGLTIAIIAAPSWPQAPAAVLAGAALALLGARLFVVAEARTPSPMLPLSFFRKRTFSVAMMFGRLFIFAFFGVMFVLTLHLH